MVWMMPLMRGLWAVFPMLGGIVRGSSHGYQSIILMSWDIVPTSAAWSAARSFKVPLPLLPFRTKLGFHYISTLNHLGSRGLFSGSLLPQDPGKAEGMTLGSTSQWKFKQKK